MPPKGKKSLSLSSQRSTKGQAAKKSKTEKDGAQTSLNAFFVPSTSQSIKANNDGNKTDRAPLSTLGASEANERREAPRLQTIGRPSTQSEKCVAADQPPPIARQTVASGSTLFMAAAGSKRSRDLVQMATQQASTASPVPNTSASASKTPATLFKNRPTLANCPGPLRGSMTPAPSAPTSIDKLERHATFGLGSDAYEPSLSQECHDLLAEEEDDGVILAFDGSTPSKHKRSRSFPPIQSLKSNAPAVPPARPLGRATTAAQGSKERVKGLEKKGRSLSAPHGAAVELRQIISQLQNNVQNSEGSEKETPHQIDSPSISFAAEKAAGLGSGQTEPPFHDATCGAEEERPKECQAGEGQAAAACAATKSGGAETRIRFVREPLVNLSDASRVRAERSRAAAKIVAPSAGPAAAAGASLSAKLAAATGRTAGQAAPKGAKRGRQGQRESSDDDEAMLQAVVEVEDLLASLKRTQAAAAHKSAPRASSGARVRDAQGKAAAELGSASVLEAASDAAAGRAAGRGSEEARSRGGGREAARGRAGPPSVALQEDYASLLDSFFLDDGAQPKGERPAAAPGPDADRGETNDQRADAASCGHVGEQPQLPAPRRPTEPPVGEAAGKEGADADADVAGRCDRLGDHETQRSSDHAAPSRRVEWVSNAWKDARRCRVVEVAWRQDADGKQKQVLHLLDPATQEASTVELEDDWLDTEVHPGEDVVVVGSGDFKRRAAQPPDSVPAQPQHGSLLVVHPHTLVSATRVGDAFDCCRKGVLCERVKDDQMAESALVGNMLHAVFQDVLVARDWSQPTMTAMVDKAMSNTAIDLFAANVDERRARDLVAEMVPRIQSWCERHLAQTPKASAPRISFGRQRNAAVAVSGVRDIEEMVHTSKYGIKGQIDASVDVCIEEGEGHTHRSLMPLELKSGKEYLTHRAQVMLYTFLMKERYPQEDHTRMDSGLLVYLKSDSTHGVPVNPLEINHIVQGRNRMARHLATGTLPSVLGDEFKCKRCFQAGICSLYHAAVEGGGCASFGAAEAFEEHAGHLSAAQLLFFKKWEYAISCEEADERRKRTQLWTLTGPEREAGGSCFARMQLLPSAAAGTAPRGSVRRIFERFDSDAEYQERFRLRRAPLSQIAVTAGDRVTVRVEGGSATAGSGTVVEVTGSTVAVELRRDLDDMSQACGAGETVLWRVDKEEFGGQFGKARRNLANLFQRKEGDERRRRLVVDLEAPRLQAVDPNMRWGAHLNLEQQEAIQRIVEAQDYVLLHGMPGTGKTTTIAWAVKALVEAKRRVLVTAFTHSAVDHVLVKLGQLGVDFLRLAPSQHSVHPAVRPHVLQEDQIRSGRDLAARLEAAQVVGTTCLNVHTAVLRRAHFDVCVVDEASQVTLPHCLGPLRLADTFALVGDHHQLPPLVTNQEARSIMGTSLFKRLSEAHPSALATLHGQYRMNDAIMGLANELVYFNQLRCASDGVANFRLPLQNPAELAPAWSCEQEGVAPWVAAAVHPHNAVVLLDTEGSGCLEEREGGMHNDGEAVVVGVLVEALRKCGLQAEQMGVICPYRAQIKTIRSQLANCGAADVEVSTVDSYQGRDKDCILMSFVRNHPDGQVGDLLSDWRRVNVAVTRAKGKLVLIGSTRTMRNNETLSKMLAYAHCHGAVLSLGPQGLTRGCPQWAIAETERQRERRTAAARAAAVSE